MLSKQRAFRLVKPAAVGGNRAGGENAAFIEMDCGTFSVLGNAVVHLFLGLREMDVYTDLFCCSEFCTPAEAFGRDRVNRVRSDGCLDPGIVQRADGADEILRSFALGLPLPGIKEVDETVGEGCTDAGLTGCPGC